MDKLSGNEIIVRSAGVDEKLVTIDGIQRTLNPGVMVISDGDKACAIAGIIGGANSAISPLTKNVLLESACFNPVRIRRSSLSLGVSTDSSYRFERGIGCYGVIHASDRAACLIRDIAKAQIGAFLSSGRQTLSAAKVILRVAYLNKILGTALKPAQIKQILTRLGYKARGSGVLEVSVPLYRHDTAREADLIEEVARIYGYERITAAAPSIIIAKPNDSGKDFAVKRDTAKNVLVSGGFNEIVSYSLIGREMIEGMPWDEDDCAVVKNPQNKEQEIMRPSLLPGILKAVAYNISRQLYDIRLFELSRTYARDRDKYLEENRLAIALYANPHAEGKCVVENGFFQLKGAIMCLMDSLGLREPNFENTMSQLFDEYSCMAVLSDSIMLGCFGRLRDGIASNFGITGAVYAGEINFDQICALARTHRSYKPLPRFPYTYRDISFAVDMSIGYQQIAGLIRHIGGHTVENIRLLNEYRGKQIEEGRRGIAMRVIFRSREKTLTEEEINALDASIRSGIKEFFGAILR
jgi:phenylalanyl-tRNA synthetase beta chain